MFVIKWERTYCVMEKVTTDGNGYVVNDAQELLLFKSIIDAQNYLLSTYEDVRQLNETTFRRLAASASGGFETWWIHFTIQKAKVN